MIEVTNLHRKCKNQKTKRIESFQIHIGTGLFLEMEILALGGRIELFQSPHHFFYVSKNFDFVRIKHVKTHFFQGYLRQNW